MIDKNEETQQQDGKKQNHAWTSPYGPHHGEGDQAAGGADSSPFEATPSGERLEEAQEEASPDQPSH